MTQFGRTWWGGQWLRALDRIDYSNRLERGRRYANNGSVKAISVVGNRITAKVQGTMPKPYNVTVVVPPFFDEQKEPFLRRIGESPRVLSRLLNRELPEELLELARKNGIKVFPESWQDIKLNCDCPDWAVPCKHLAAVIYMVANEIDQNPFLVFGLHGLDIIAALKERGLDMAALERESIPSLNDLAAPAKARKRPAKAGAAKERGPAPEPPDLSRIEDLRGTLPGLFPSKALFYSGDIAAVMRDAYKRIAREEARTDHRKAPGEALDDALRFQRFTVTFAPLGPPVVHAHGDGPAEEVALERLLGLIGRTEAKHLESYSPSFIALYHAQRFCAALAARGAMLPRLLDCGGTAYRTLWEPALLNEGVKELFDGLLAYLPEDMVLVETVPPKKKKKGTRASVQPAAKATLPEEGLRLLCALFLNASVDRAALLSDRAFRAGRPDAKVLELLFGGAPVDFAGFQEREVPNTVQLWLSRLFLGGRRHVPVIAVNEKPDSFEVEVRVQARAANGELPRMETLRDFMRSAEPVERMALLKDLDLLSVHYADLGRVIATEGREQLVYPAQGFTDVLTRVLPVLRLFGIKALLPKSLQQLLRPRPSLKLTVAGGKKSYFSLDGLMAYDWQVAMGDVQMPAKEFAKLAKGTMGLVRVRENYVLMDEAEVMKVLRALEAPPAPTGFQLLQAALSGEHDGAAVAIDDKLRKRIKELLGEGEVPVPAALKAELRPYQERGYGWLRRNASLGLGSLLADDMGLGKTVQVIAALLKFKEEGELKGRPALVVLPTTLLTNWANELERFAPDLRVHTFHGPGRKPPPKGTEVVLTTYGVARTDNAKLMAGKWRALVIDEAQNIKNPETAQTKAVKRIPAGTRIALSGTPVENRLSEYWSILDFANPGYLGTVGRFASEYAKPIELDQDRACLERFKLITGPFIMRRVKTDKRIISDLPEKVENDRYCVLTKEQAALYQNITHDLMAEVAQADGASRRGLVLKLLTILKQVCNHPAQYLKNGSEDVDLSGKAMMLAQLLETIYENNEKVLVFSQFREMGDILARMVRERFGKEPLQLHGGCSRKERDGMVRAFQSGGRHDTFILSLKAGGTGLNLTAAANVVHYDLWWNPAAESQATDRAFRIGQKRNVMVHRLITKGTLEERIDEMVRGKKRLADLTVGTGEKWIGDLSDKDLRTLVELG